VVVGAGAQTADEDSAEDEADDAPMEDDLVADPPLDIATESTDETDGTEEGTKETAEAAVLRVTRLRVPELRAELRELGLADDGKRQDLLDRLAAHFTGSAEDVVQANRGREGFRYTHPYFDQRRRAAIAPLRWAGQSGNAR